MDEPPAVLVLSDLRFDYHAAIVCEKLDELGAPWVALDPADVVNGSVAFAVGVGSPCSAGVRLRDQVVDFGSIQSVLYRRPNKITSNDDIEPDYRELVVSEWNAFIQGLWEVLPASCRWVSHPTALRRAELKILQLQVGQQLGLRVPRTIVTNDVDELKKFWNTCPAGVVFKKLRSHNIITESYSALFVTKRLDDLQQVDANELRLCPVIFQELIPKAFDARVIVVGREVDGFRIASQAVEEAAIDYRAAGETLAGIEHTHYELDSELADKLVQMTQGFGLEFGAYDFAVTPDEQHIFLELNPNGQWLWLQLATGIDLAGKLARLLRPRTSVIAAR
jgi:glutathione synthase/RimK-type ligase-like ATP-grasp enzyme